MLEYSSRLIISPRVGERKFRTTLITDSCVILSSHTMISEHARPAAGETSIQR